MLKFDKVSALKKIIIILLAINILFSLGQAGSFLVLGQPTFLIVSLIKILISSAFIYFIVKGSSKVFLILAAFAGLSIASSFRAIGALQTTLDKSLFFYDLASITLIILASLYIYFKIVPSKSKIFVALKNLNNKEVPFWSSATFFVLGVSCALIALSLFLPFGIIENKEANLINLFLGSWSLFLILLSLSLIFAVYAIVKKSYLKSFLSSIFLGIFLLLTIDKYQGMVEKVALLGQDILVFASLACLLIFTSGIFIIAEAILNKDYFKHSKY